MTVQDGMAFNPHRRKRSDSTDSHGSHDSHENEENAAIAMWMYTVLIASVPLFYMGNTKAALCFLLIGAVYRYIDYFVRPIPEEDKMMIKYNIYEPHDILIDVIGQQKKFLDEEIPCQRYRTTVLSAIAALAKKYETIKLQQNYTQKQGISPSDNQTKENQQKVQEHTALICQEAVYLGLISLDGADNDEVIESAFSLLALVAKSEAVRERHLHNADKFGFDVLMTVMNASLTRAKASEDELTEQRLAELQRKGCLMLGALADNDTTISEQIVREGGITSILAALSWYRFHDGLAGWGLWSIFTLCYENNSNTCTLIDDDGVPIIIRTMKNNLDSVEVSRHGTAIIFDLFRRQREESTRRIDWNKVRTFALNEGLHDVVTSIVEKFSDRNDTMDIVLMARELLVSIESVKH